MAYEVVRSGASRSAPRRETYVEEEEVVIRRAVRRRPNEDVEPRRASRRLDDGDYAPRSRRPVDDDEYITIRRPRAAADEPIRVKVEEDAPKEPGFIQRVGTNGGKLLATGVGVGGFVGFWYGALQALSGSHMIPGLGRLATSGVAPGLLMGAGVVAMLGAGAVWHWLNPKK